MPAESAPLLSLAKANAELILDLQCRRANEDGDPRHRRHRNCLHKRAAKRAYDGNRDYQPVLALGAERDVILTDEFRDGNVPAPAGSSNRRGVEKALAALSGGIDKIYLRGDSALYEHELMRWLDEQAIGYAISADMSPQLAECIAALPENHWKPDREEADGVFHPGSKSGRQRHGRGLRKNLQARLRPDQPYPECRRRPRGH